MPLQPLLFPVAGRAKADQAALPGVIAEAAALAQAIQRRLGAGGEAVSIDHRQTTHSHQLLNVFPCGGTPQLACLLLQQAAGALVATCESEEWATREGAWSTLQSLARLRWPWANVLAPHVRRPERAEKWLFSRLPEWEEAPERGGDINEAGWLACPLAGWVETLKNIAFSYKK